MKAPILLHPNYCEDGQPLEALFQLAQSVGADGVEVRRARKEYPDPERYLEEIGRLRDRYQLEWVVVGGVGPNLTLSSESDRRREVEATIALHRQAANRLGVRLFNVLTGWLQHPDVQIDYLQVEYHGSAAITPAGWQWQIDGLRELAQAAEATSVQLALETHSCYAHDLPGPTAELLRQVGSPNLGALLDYANYVVYRQRPTVEETLRTLKGRIFYAHLKNLLLLENGARIVTSLADGQVNNRNLLRGLFADGFTGPLCIEAPRRGDGEWFACKDIEYLRHVLETLETPDKSHP